MNYTVQRLQSLLGDGLQLQSHVESILNRAPDLDPSTTVEVTDTEMLFFMKLATLVARKSLVDLACYPLSETAVVFYDANGNPL